MNEETTDHRSNRGKWNSNLDPVSKIGARAVSYTHLDVYKRQVMGPQEKMFTKEGRETFLNSEYTVTSEFDRMGCRLEGPFIAYKTTSDIISDGIAFGSVQVPSHGKPIILLADRQTTGGYATVSYTHLDVYKRQQKRMEGKTSVTSDLVYRRSR